MAQSPFGAPGRGLLNCALLALNWASSSSHHKRTRTSGAQRGTTVKAAEPDGAAPPSFAQISATNRPQVPAVSQAEGFERPTPTRSHGPVGVVAPGDGIAPWLKPVGVQRDIRAPGRSARPPSGLAVGGWGPYGRATVAAIGRRTGCW